MPCNTTDTLILRRIYAAKKQFTQPLHCFALLFIELAKVTITPNKTQLENVMKFKMLVSAAVLSIAALSSSVVMAKPHKESFNMYRMLLSERGISRLDLTKVQQDKIKSIADAEKAALKAFKERNPNTRADVKALVHAEVFDEVAFRQMLAKQQSERTELAVMKAKNKNAVWNTLTTEQQEKLKKVMKRKNKQKRSKQHAEK